MQSEQELTDKMLEVLHRAGIDPALIYAFKKTGRLITADNAKHLPSEAIDEWNAAIAEYNTANLHA
ncbi:MAG: hypothetical protein IPK80_07945 [Nannocystis sp.]|nr:hypothetical protein [Nannocystis sp.]